MSKKQGYRRLDVPAQKASDAKLKLSEDQIIVQEENDLQRIPFRETALTKDQRIARNIITGADLSLQYVGRQFANFIPQIRALPAWNDDTTQRFGIGIYDRMKKDAEVSASLDVLTLASTSSMVRFLPAVPQSDPRYDQAKAISDYFKWMFSDYTVSDIDEVRLAMVDQALTYGSSTAELTYSVVDHGKYRNFIALKNIKPNCIEEVNFLVDNFNNIMGLVPRFSGYHATFFSDSGVVPVSDLEDSRKREKILKHVIPRKKFMVMSWRPQCGDPRGQSVLRAAYTFWWVKQEIINNMMSWIEKFSQPSIVGEVSPNAQPTCEVDENGVPIPGTEVQPAQVLLEQLTKFSASSALAVPSGTKISMLNVPNTGQIFIDLISMANREIARAIVKQHLATSEGQHQSRSAADVHQNILSLIIILIKNWQIKNIHKDIMRPVTIMNFGNDAFDLIPIIDVGDSDGFPLDPFEVSQLMGVGYLSEDQLPKIDRLIGIPQRNPEFSLADPQAQDQATDAEEGESLVTNEGGIYTRSGSQANQMTNMLNRLNSTIREMEI